MGAVQAPERKRFKVVGDPTRYRVLTLMRLRDRWTAKELAESLGVDPNRLYYHLRILEEAELIQVVDTQASGRMVERIYGLTENWRVTYDPREPEERIHHLRAQLAATSAAAEDAIFAQARQAEAGERPTYIDYATPGTYTALPEDFAEFNDKVKALVKELHEKARARRASGEAPPEGWRELSFLYVLVEKPLPVWYQQDSD